MYAQWEDRVARVAYGRVCRSSGAASLDVHLLVKALLGFLWCGCVVANRVSDLSLSRNKQMVVLLGTMSHLQGLQSTAHCLVPLPVTLLVLPVVAHTHRGEGTRHSHTALARLHHTWSSSELHGTQRTALVHCARKQRKPGSSCTRHQTHTKQGEINTNSNEREGGGWVFTYSRHDDSW